MTPQARDFSVQVGDGEGQVAQPAGFRPGGAGRGRGEGKKLERFKPGQTYGKITLLKQLVKSKKLRYHVACDCGYEFDVDPYLLTLADGHKNKIGMCQQCKSSQ